MLSASALPAVTPHSARHSLISVLGARAWRGPVAKLTRRMRGDDEAVKALDRAYPERFVTEITDTRPAFVPLLMFPFCTHGGYSDRMRQPYFGHHRGRAIFVLLSADVPPSVSG